MINCPQKALQKDPYKIIFLIIFTDLRENYFLYKTHIGKLLSYFNSHYHGTFREQFKNEISDILKLDYIRHLLEIMLSLVFMIPYFMIIPVKKQ
jgi:hypothetical protein